MEVSKTYVSIGANTAPLAAGLNKAKGMVATSTATMTKKLAGIGKGMTIAGALIVAGFGSAIKTAKKFEQSMANTASVAGATAEELKTLSDYARKMGEQSVFSASQAADGMYYLASAGMNVNEIMGALKGTLDLAAATASDLAYTSESVAATLSQFGFAAEEAGRVSNVFAAAISGSQATMEKMTNSMSYVGPMAKSMGMSLETTTGILMNLYNAGLNGSKAGTSLRMAFVKLIDPTTKGINALERLEVAIKDSSGEMRPFEDIIDDLGRAGMTTADAMDIFGIRAGPAMMALVSQGEGAIREMTEAVTGTNKAAEMAAMQINTFEGAIKLLKSAFEEAQITLVQELLPALKGMIEQITEGVKKVTAWMKENPKLTATIVKWTAAIGALMLLLGPLLIILPGLVTGAGFFTVGIGLLTGKVILATIAFVAWWEVVKAIDEILHSSHTTIEDVAKAEEILAQKQAELAKKLGLTTEEFIKLQKAGASVSEMMKKGAEKVADWDAYNEGLVKLNELAEKGEISASELYKAMQKLAIETGVAKDEASGLEIGLGEIISTVKDVKLEIEMLTKKYEAYGDSVEDSIKYYDKMIEKLDEIDVILQTELALLEEGTEAYKEKQKEIYENIKAINGIKEALGELMEPLTGLDLIAVKMVLLGDSVAEIPAKLELLREKAVLLKQALDEAVPETKAWWEAKKAYEEVQESIEDIIKSFDEYGEKGKKLLENLINLTDKQKKLQEAMDVTGVDKTNLAYQRLKIEYNANETAIASLIMQINNLETEQREAEQSAKDLADAYKSITDKIYELTHTPLENAIYKLDQQKQSYIDLGMEIGIVNKWYDLQIAKLHELNPELDETTKKLEEAGVAAQKIGILGGNAWDNFATSINRARISLSNFTKEGLAAMIATIKMKFFPILQDLYKSLNTAGSYAFIVQGQIANVLAMQAEQIATAMYGLEAYNEALANLGGSTNNPTTPSYATGTSYVPQTGMALLHKGEAVIPANQNTYNNSNSFSPTVNLSVQGGGDSNQIAQEVENVLWDMGRQFKRRGFERIPGRG